MKDPLLDFPPLTRSLGTRCRVCGCTFEHACVDPQHGPCWWLEPDLCSHCGEPLIVAGEYDRLAAAAKGRVLTDAELGQLFDWTHKARAALGRASGAKADVFEL